MIKQAAIRIDGEVWTLPKPARHNHIINAYFNVHGERIPADSIQGFITTENGVFLSRRAAAFHAYEDLQIVEPKEELYSEDLW